MKQVAVKPFSSQQGAALFVALIILLIVSMMGVSAMKGSIFSEKMAFNSQARDLSFQAAETAINGVINQARRSDTFAGSLFASATPVRHCLTRNQLMVEGACADGVTFDQRQSLYAQAESLFIRQRVAFDHDTSAIMDYQFHTLGEGGFASDSLPFENRNLQEWRKLGPGGGPFSVSQQAQRELGLAPPAAEGGEG